MHRGLSSRTRGASVVGAILLVALISAAAVAIDSGKLEKGNEMLALATTPLREATSEKKDSTPTLQELVQTCHLGYDYVVRIHAANEEKLAIGVTRGPEDYKTFENPQEANQCPSGTTAATHGRQCTKDGWRCRTYSCTPANIFSDKKEKCRYMGDTKVDESLDPKKTATDWEKNTADDIASVTAEGNLSQDQQNEIAKYQKLGTSEDLLGAYEKKSTVLDKELELKQRERDEAAEAYRKANCTQSGTCAGVSPEDRAKAAAELAKKEEELKRIQEQQARLAAARKDLEVTQSRRDDTGNGAGEIDRCAFYRGTPMYHVCLNSESGDQREQRIVVTTFGPGSDYGAYSGYNRTQLEDACRRGETRACQILAGVASPSSGSTGSGCGSASQGGLIGTIVSLFRKSNSNCQNGNNGSTPTCTITASPTNISTGGQPVTLTWQSQRAFSANLSSMGSVAPQGSVTVNPQTTTTYTLQVDGYRDNYTGQQLRGQCSAQVVVGGQGGGDGAPKAEISCRPEVADVGMSVALSFACRNSATSGGTGFDTNGQLSGSATPIVESPTLGSNNVVKYGLTCSKEGKTDTAECTVRVNTPSIVLIANPKEVQSGGEANIGWVTGGMEECTISSPTLSGFTAENAGNTSTSGVAKTPSLTQETKFVLSCTTKSGGTKTAETTVQIR